MSEQELLNQTTIEDRFPTQNFTDCPDFTEETNDLLKSVSFWIEGVLSCIFAAIGVFANVGTSVVLSGKGTECPRTECQKVIGTLNFFIIYLLLP